MVDLIQSIKNHNLWLCKLVHIGWVIDDTLNKTTNIGYFRGHGGIGPHVEKNLEETSKYLLVLLNKVFLTH